MDNKIIIPLDLEYSEAIHMAKKFDANLCRLKIGSQLFTSSGPQIIKELNSLGFDVFLDLKFHDIPNTVYEAVKSAADLGIWMVNVHASGGRAMLEASKKALEGFDQPPLLIAVTVLTSLSEDSLNEVGIKDLSEQVLRLAELTNACDLNGVVCASTDVKAIKNIFGKDFITVTPGIRPNDSKVNDQNRISTPSEAVKNGSDYLVIGRPITESENPTKALEKIIKEIL
tara:strand:- start:802 stop:1485 length:684 start_codon:yes stop_codon:yes gene_type:complete